MEFTVQSMIDRYNQYNKSFFFGELPSLDRIEFIVENKDDADYGGYTKIDRDKSDFKSKDIYYIICVNAPSIYDEKDLNSVMCHEMIHIWQFNDIDFKKYDSDYRWIVGHNSAFISKMKSINYLARELGLDVKVTLVKEPKLINNGSLL